ncbi:MAG: hypothetical protein Q9159_007004 [Coniocarpon cinnabarinum]
MSWWWSTSTQAKEHTSVDVAAALEQSNVQSSSPSSSSPSAVPASPPQTRDETAFAELRAALTEVNPAAAEAATKSVRDNPNSATQEPAPSLYPDTMSCTQAFDNAYYCASMGGQLNNIYRYGGLRSCTEQWKQWRFCMRMKTMSEDEKKKRIREWYLRKDAVRRVGKSSEDVWEVRQDPVEGAFQKNVDDLGVTGVERG